ncbi:MAG: hypothetical protein HY219_00360 [Candidatus Staskawiczbacteria bacterium]|nr:hypothetical protein [Candidatus Staskawiczbacteria bacterium]
MFNFIKNLDKNILSVGIAIIAVSIVGVLMFTNGGINGNFSQSLDKIKSFNILGSSKDVLAQKGIDYINNSILSGQKANLVSTSEESGVIKMKINIGGKEFDSYVSKDGKLLFPEAIHLGESTNKQPATNDNQPQKTSAANIVKSDKAELDAYVVSACPFGLQMQRVLSDVVKSAPSLAQNIKVRYIGSVANGAIVSMHGDAEAQENLKQICIREEQSSKYWNYISCYMKAGDTAGCLSSTGIDKTKLSSCASDKNRGLTFAQKDFDLTSKYSIQGSPTLILNGQTVSEFDFGGRTSDALKSLICSGYKNEPQDCSKKLNTVSAATSFSVAYAGTGDTGNSGSNTNPNCAPAK